MIIYNLYYYENDGCSMENGQHEGTFKSIDEIEEHIEMDEFYKIDGRRNRIKEHFVEYHSDGECKYSSDNGHYGVVENEL